MPGAAIARARRGVGWCDGDRPPAVDLGYRVSPGGGGGGVEGSGGGGRREGPVGVGRAGVNQVTVLTAGGRARDDGHQGGVDEGVNTERGPTGLGALEVLVALEGGVGGEGGDPMVES